MRVVLLCFEAPLGFKVNLARSEIELEGVVINAERSWQITCGVGLNPFLFLFDKIIKWIPTFDAFGVSIEII